MIRLVAFLLMLPGAALACACCAERGERQDYTVKLGEWEREELGRLRATSPARLYTTACGMECVKGVRGAQTAYEVMLGMSGTRVEFDLVDAGRLVFEMPQTYSRFAVDTDPMAAETKVTLYTELRLKGRVSGTGDFADVQSARGELVFSGPGNACFNVDSLQAWGLSVEDEGVAFRLFGAVKAE